MTVLTEGMHTAEFLVSEGNGHISREVVTIAAGADLEPCTVLGKITASGKYVQVDPAAADGSEVAAAVLYAAAKAATADATEVAIVRHAEVNSLALVWPTGITDPEKAAAVAELAAASIIVR